MARRRRHEEDENHEAWAIPYGDLVTLLLAFFVVMYSMSSVNDGKYRVLSDSLNAAFHGAPRAPPAASAGRPPTPIAAALPESRVDQMIAEGLPEQGNLRDTGLQLSVAGGGSTAAARPAPPAPLQPAPAVGLDGRAAAARAAAQRELDRVAADVTAALQGLIATGRARVHRHGDWVTVDISTDILFPSGVARLSPPAIAALQRLARVLAPWPNAIRVEGHTDDRPIDTRAFPSNWELSAARAASVVRLFVKDGIAPERLAVLGFGQYRPLRPNTTAAGRNANRRVEVVILGRDAAPEAGL